MEGSILFKQLRSFQILLCFGITKFKNMLKTAFLVYYVRQLLPPLASYQTPPHIQ